MAQNTSGEVTVGLEGRTHVIAERDLARLSGLRRADHATDHVLTDREAPGHEVHVLPAQREHLSVPHSGLQRDEDHRAQLTLCGFDQAIGFIEVEEVDLVDRQVADQR